MSKSYIFFVDIPPTESASKPQIEHVFTRENGYVSSYQVNNFQCVFPFLNSADPLKPYLYQIHWYINADLVHVTEAVKREDFVKTYLNENNGILKMGIRVSIFLSEC